MAYLAAGIVLILSHHFHSYPVLIYFGHMLIASSLITSISLMLAISSAISDRWLRRVYIPLDIFSGVTFIVTFAVGIIIFFIDEFAYYKENSLLSQSLLDSLFLTAIVVIFMWVLLLYIPYIVRLFRRSTSIKNRKNSLLIVGSLVVVIINQFLNLVPLHILVPLIIVIILIYFSKSTKFRRITTLIHLSHIFAAFFITSIVAASISHFTKAISANVFWISSGIGLITFITSLLLLYKWRRLCFKLAVRAITRIFHYTILVSVFLIRLSIAVIAGTISFLKKGVSSLVNRVTVLIRKISRDNLPN